MQRRSMILATGGWFAASLFAGCASTAAPPTGLWFVFLETGRPTPADREAVMAMQRGHITNFKRLFGEGKLLAAGPMADPAKHKRGLVVVQAGSLDELRNYFVPDDYVREGYMALNAVPALARRPLHTIGIDDSRVEEVRIVLIARPQRPAGAAVMSARQALLEGLIDRGTLGAWYTLQSGPVAEVLLARTTDTATLQAALAPYTALADDGADVQVWRQWISPGVVGPR